MRTVTIILEAAAIVALGTVGLALLVIALSAIARVGVGLYVKFDDWRYTR